MTAATATLPPHVPTLAPRRFEPFMHDDAARAAIEAANASARELLAGRAMWHVSSSSAVGGVAELLRSDVAYLRGSGVDARWETIAGDAEFFELASSLHQQLHGAPGRVPLDSECSRYYEAALAAASRDIARRISPGDLVVMHDPHTAGLVPGVRAAGGIAVWRCHVGTDEPNDSTREAWRFLMPFVGRAQAWVFTRAAFAWEGLDPARVFVLPPVLNPLSPKNQGMSDEVVAAILARVGLQTDGPMDTSFVRLDGTPGRVDRPVVHLGYAPIPRDAELVVQVSQWNALKNPEGLVELFARFVAPERPDAHLILAGPTIRGVPDEAASEAVFAATVHRVRALSPEVRARVHVVQVPVDDPDEAAAIVNAIQRRATVVVQNSSGEGFGLSVLEAMWKERPVVCSRVGGLQDQVVDGETGFLVEPGDYEAGGAAICRLLADPDLRARMGAAGRDRVGERYLLPHDAARWVPLIETLLVRRAARRFTRSR